MADRTVLVIGAHPDDEVLGAGRTIAKHAAMGGDVHVLIVTEGATQQYEDDRLEQKRQASRACGDRRGVADVHFGDLPDMRLDDVAHVEVNSVIEDAIETLEPTLVYTHDSWEVNLDHTTVYESTIVATRPQSGVERVLSYEVPSSTNWTGGGQEWFRPTVYVEIEDTLDRKVEGLAEYEPEERAYPHPRSERALRAQAEVRGTEAGYEAAEAFRLVKEYSERCCGHRNAGGVRVVDNTSNRMKRSHCQS